MQPTANSVSSDRQEPTWDASAWDTAQDASWDTASSPYAQVSAWADGEGEGRLPDILSTEQGREAWDVYHLIGDTLRSGDLAMATNDRLQARILAALQSEPAIVTAPVVPVSIPVSVPVPSASPAASSSKSAVTPRRWLRMSLSGLAVAAAVAAVAWMVQPYLGGSVRDDSQTVADAGNAAIEESSLRDYLEAHRQMAGPSAVRQVSFDTGTSR